MAALARRNRRRGAQFRALERKSLAKGESGVAGNSSNGSGSGRAINRVFTRGVITDLVERGRSEVFDAVARSCISDPEGKTHGQIISEIYARLGREHRNEYYYMNTLLNRLLAGARGAGSAAALSQVPIGRHVADFVMIGGEGRGEGQGAGQSDGRVYEIKSDLDNCDRLRGQLCGFYKAFSKVSVLAGARGRGGVERLLADLGGMGEAVGIYALSERGAISGRAGARPPKPFDEYLDHACIFKLLRKREYESVISRKFGELPQVAPAFHFRACLERFRQMPIKEAQGMAFGELKKRNEISRAAFERIQPELKSAVYFAGLSRKLPQLEELLQSNYRGRQDVFSLFQGQTV